MKVINVQNVMKEYGYALVKAWKRLSPECPDSLVCETSNVLQLYPSLSLAVSNNQLRGDFI